MKHRKIVGLILGWGLGAALVLTAAGVTPQSLASAMDMPFVGSSVGPGEPAGAAANSDAPAVFRDLPRGYAEPAAALDAHLGTADFSETEARRRLEIVARALTEQAAGTPHLNPESGVMVREARVDGHGVRFEDMALVEFRFASNVSSYTTSVGTFGGFREPSDAWIAVWERTGADAAEVRGGPAVIRVIAVMEDATGAVHDLQIQQFAAPQ